jgi:hypothetical protein
MYTLGASFERSGQQYMDILGASVEILRHYCIDCMNFINLTHFLFLYIRDIYTKISNGNFLVYILISNDIICYSTITYFIIIYYYYYYS